MMHVAKTIKDVRDHVAAARKSGKRIGFVPTMGYLHEGHLSLVAESKKHAEYQVMSIFVNRIQFNDPRDFDKYPIDLDRDYRLAEGAGVDLVFVPDEREMYKNRLTYVDVDLLTEHLCGAHRPGHFRGVYTVVSKLFNIVQPDVSVFGQKDIQQAVSIEKMVADLDFPIRIIIAPTVREMDGLAMSSRNARLSPDERTRALAISRSLKKAEEMLRAGERGTAAIAAAMRKEIESSAPTSIDYISIVRYADLAPADAVTEKSVIATAVFYGVTRLIDNMIVEVGEGGVRCVY
ncbi:MAG TPA: pantoate--beta-alanine ligase [Anaerolineaceae bacterium]|nr:pantoate--beta-alanine ligase [Anaerolineaceae bacterium]